MIAWLKNNDHPLEHIKKKKMQVVYMGPVELPEKNHPKKIKKKFQRYWHETWTDKQEG